MYKVAVEKVGTVGGLYTITLYSGKDHSSYLKAAISVTSSTVSNLSNVPGATVTDALNSLETARGRLTHNVTVAGVGTVGAVSDGDVFLQGRNLTEVLEQLVRKEVAPTYVIPTASISVSPTTTQEIGSTLTYTITPGFTQNDAGALTGVEFKKSAASIHTQSNLNAYAHTSQVVQPGSQQYLVDIDYAQGPIKNNSLGVPDATGRIMAGAVTKSTDVNGAYYHVYGSFSTIPTDGVVIKANGTSTFSNTFTLNTGSVNKFMVIAIPATKTLYSVIDIDALGTDLTAQYVLDTNITTLKDGGGNDVTYKVYRLSLATPYNADHKHNVTLT